MAQSNLIWKLKTSFKKNCNKVDSTRTYDGQNDGEQMHNTLVATSNIFHNAKCKYFFPKLFCQIMELNMKWSNKFPYNQTNAL
jgi:hypothetical protein